MANEFKGNQEIKNTIMSLAEKKPIYRKIRGYGNSFYRKAVIQYFEKLLEEPIDLDKKKINTSKIIKIVEKVFKGDLIKCKFAGNNRELKIYEEKYENKEVAYKKLLELIQEKLNTN